MLQKLLLKCTLASQLAAWLLHEEDIQSRGHGKFRRCAAEDEKSCADWFSVGKHTQHHREFRLQLNFIKDDKR
jgi:hypothetical protein